MFYSCESVSNDGDAQEWHESMKSVFRSGDVMWCDAVENGICWIKSDESNKIYVICQVECKKKICIANSLLWLCHCLSDDDFN